MYVDSKWSYPPNKMKLFSSCSITEHSDSYKTEECGTVNILNNNIPKVSDLVRVNQYIEQSGRSPKVVALFQLQTLVAIYYDYFNCMIQSKWNQILVSDLEAFISQNKKNVWFFEYHLLTCSVREMVLICLMQNINMCLLYKSHKITRLVSHLINHFSKWIFTV